MKPLPLIAIGVIGIGIGATILGARLGAQAKEEEEPTTIDHDEGEGPLLPLLPFPGEVPPGESTELEIATLQVATDESVNTREDPGPPANDGAVSKYFDGAHRLVNGAETPTGHIVGWDWCAAAASWCANRAATLLGRTAKMRQRIAVWELVEDAIANGTFIPLADVKVSDLALGCLVIMKREGQSPLDKAKGHCGFLVGIKADVTQTDPDLVSVGPITLDPNAGETWAEQDRQWTGLNGVVGIIRIEAE